MRSGESGEPPAGGGKALAHEVGTQKAVSLRRKAGTTRRGGAAGGLRRLPRPKSCDHSRAADVGRGAGAESDLPRKRR
nr:MAG TPA_asm: hypothetical protein [Caudoviricetes sp.]